MTFEGPVNSKEISDEEEYMGVPENILEGSGIVHDLSDDEVISEDAGMLDERTPRPKRGLGAVLRRAVGIGSVGVAGLVAGESLTPLEAQGQSSTPKIEMTEDSVRLAEIKESWKKRDISDVTTRGRRALELLENVDGLGEGTKRGLNELARTRFAIDSTFPDFINRYEDLRADAEYKDMKANFFNYKYGDLIAIGQAVNRMQAILNKAVASYRLPIGSTENLRANLVRIKYNLKYLPRLVSELQVQEVKKDSTNKVIPPGPASVKADDWAGYTTE